MTQDKETVFQKADRPDVALITNHGYAGVEIPFGGAPDTGGQNMYVNSLAVALDNLGYRVTIFARGGFPYFESDRIRERPEYLTGHVRYIFVPGGGGQFIRKEDIAVALDEQVAWLDRFIRQEAADRGCPPWELYEFVNTHYWDAAVLGMRLVERWQDDIAADMIAEILSGCVPDELLAGMREDRHWISLGGAPAYHMGSMLIEAEASPATPIIQRVRAAASKWAAACRKGAGMEVDRLVGAVASALAEVEDSTAPALHALVAAEAFGEAFFDVFPDRAKRLEKSLCAADRHVWTPHSLAALKEENFRERSGDVVRALKFCERRDHERAVCDRTKAFAATSTKIAERLRTAYGVPSEQIFYFPPCVNRAVFRKYSREETEPAYQYLARVSGIDAQKLRSSKIVFETSRMDQTKRKGLLLDAFAYVARERQDALLFIGGGPENDLFHSLIKRRDAKPELRGRAFLTGFIPDEHIGPLFSMADVYASASEMEGFGMSVLQAAASGTAVVCSDLVPFAVQYVHEEALIVPAGEVFDFAQAVGNLLESEPDRSRRALRLGEKVKMLDWKAQAVAFLQYLRGRGFTVVPGKDEQ